MDFHIPSVKEIIEIFTSHPIFIVVIFGQLFGFSFTQMIKKTYMAFRAETNPVSIKRYQISVLWLAVCSTFFFTIILWRRIVGHDGFEIVVSAGCGFFAPVDYRIVKGIIAWKFPGLADKFGDRR